jgi:hypothetical protein
MVRRANESERDRAELIHKLDQLQAEKDRMAVARETALHEMAELRRALGEQTQILDALRTRIEAAASLEQTVSAETMRNLSAVTERLTEIHRWMDVQRTRELVHATVPLDATVLVVSKGDPELLQLDSRTGWHFPRIENGNYAGAHPADSGEAIRHLEDLRRQGAQYLVFPGSSLWWLDYYVGFTRHLETHHRAVLRREGTCLIFGLAEGPDARVAAERADAVVG